jgi:hypothetical protein
MCWAILVSPITLRFSVIVIPLPAALLAENQQETTRCRDIAVTDIDEGATSTVRGGQASRSAK